MDFEFNCSIFKCPWMTCGFHFGHSRCQGENAYDPLIFLMEGWHQTHTLDTLHPFISASGKYKQESLVHSLKAQTLTVLSAKRYHFLKLSILLCLTLWLKEKENISQIPQITQCLLTKSSHSRFAHVQLFNTYEQFCKQAKLVQTKHYHYQRQLVFLPDAWSQGLQEMGCVCLGSDSHRSLEKTNLGLFILEQTLGSLLVNTMTIMAKTRSYVA